MPDDLGYTLGQGAIDELREVVDDFRLAPLSERGGRGSRLIRQGIVEGFIVDTISLAGGPMTSPSCGEMLVVRHSGPFFDDPCDNDLAASDLRIKVVNRSQWSFAAGTYVLATWINGEWRIIPIDCEATDEGINAVMESSGTLGSGTLGSGTLGGP